MEEKDESEDLSLLAIDQKISDETYTNISLFIRDCSLEMSDFLSNEIGTIYKVVSPIYVRSSFDGLRKGIRAYILSNHIQNAPSKDKMNHSSVYEIPEDSHLKLISRTTYHEKGALIFLHLPDKGWEEFYKDTSLIDTLLVNYASREFEVQCDIKENPKSRDWLYVENHSFNLEIEPKSKDKKAKE